MIFNEFGELGAGMVWSLCISVKGRCWRGSFNMFEVVGVATEFWIRVNLRGWVQVRVCAEGKKTSYVQLILPIVVKLFWTKFDKDRMNSCF